jgi:hypothetical protein
MPMRFWASAAVFICFAGWVSGAQTALPSGGTLTYSSQGARTHFAIRTTAGRHYSLNVLRDATVAADALVANVQVIGEVPGKAVILTDSYASKPGGLSFCQAGEERFLRIVTLSGRHAKETLRLKAASCRQNLELADPGIEWDPISRTLRVHWLQVPGAQSGNGDRTIQVSADGRPTGAPK